MKFTDNVGKRKFTILVQEEPDGGFTGKCLELRGAVSYGQTIEELKENMKDAISLVLDVLEEEAKKGNYRKRNNRNFKLSRIFLNEFKESRLA